MSERRHTTPLAARAGSAWRGRLAGVRRRSAILVMACGAVTFVFVLALGCAPPSATVRAQSLLRRGRDAEAVDVLRTRLRAVPGDLSARKLLIRAVAASGDPIGARAEVDALAARLPPADPTASIELGHALELAHRYDEALDAYDQAAALAPASPAGPREGGLRSARWGEAGLARPRLEEAVRRGADDAETWHALGLVRLQMDDLAGATDAYRRGAARMPESADCWLGLATVGLRRGDAGAALAAYDQVLVRRPHFAPAELGRAWALGRLGRREEAARALDRAEELGAPAAHVAKQREALRR